MALGAMANDPTVQVKIVPVGLSYFHAHRFRSRAVVEFGTALDVPAELVEMFKEGGTKKREAVAKFLDLVYDGLKTVTIRAPDYDTLMVRFMSSSRSKNKIRIPYIAYSSCPPAVQDAWAISYLGTSGGTEQAFLRRLHTFQR